jgi:hypothetical protein
MCLAARQPEGGKNVAFCPPAQAFAASLTSCGCSGRKAWGEGVVPLTFDLFWLKQGGPELRQGLSHDSPFQVGIDHVQVGVQRVHVCDWHSHRRLPDTKEIHQRAAAKRTCPMLHLDSLRENGARAGADKY